MVGTWKMFGKIIPKKLEPLASIHYRLPWHRNTLGTIKALTWLAQSGWQRDKHAEVRMLKVLAHLGDHHRFWLGWYFKTCWKLYFETSCSAELNLTTED